jgi:hypothetical protein
MPPEKAPSHLKTTQLFLTWLFSALVMQVAFANESETNARPEIVDLIIAEKTIDVVVDLHQAFRWEHTRYESLDTFPQPWPGSPAMPYQIWFKEKGILEWLQTDMVFLGNYTTLKTHEMEASIFGYLLPITGIFNPETHRLKFDNLDYRPRFKVPDLLMEESSDLKHWSEAILSTPQPVEYEWPQRLSLKIQKKDGNRFYRVTLRTQ